MNKYFIILINSLLSLSTYPLIHQICLLCLLYIKCLLPLVYKLRFSTILFIDTFSTPRTAVCGHLGFYEILLEDMWGWNYFYSNNKTFKKILILLCRHLSWWYKNNGVENVRWSKQWHQIVLVVTVYTSPSPTHGEVVGECWFHLKMVLIKL